MHVKRLHTHSPFLHIFPPITFSLIFLVIFAFALFFRPIPAAASSVVTSNDNEVSSLKMQVASLTQLVQKLSDRVELLENTQAFDKETGAGASTSASRAPASRAPAVFPQTSGSGIQSMNPDISVTGVAIGKATDDKHDADRNSLHLKESELSFSRNVSPYTRANLTLGFSDEEAAVEEGYADISNILPGRVEARVGKFLLPLGFLNTVHAHDWPMVAKPLTLERFHGSDEGLTDHGVSLSKLIDLHSKTYMKVNVDMLSGTNSTLFNDANTRVFGGRIVTNTPLNERDDMNIGVNAYDSVWNRKDKVSSRVYGTDLMLRRRFSQTDRVALWGEYLWNRHQTEDPTTIAASGYYLNLLYKFKKVRNWHIGLEYDATQHPDDTRCIETARSAYLGWWLTENDRLQFQFRNIRDPFNNRVNNEFWIQFIWGMGPHKPHLANF
ncbi:MAG: hypothetical protein WA705_18385 [Candidatus Ozemobacteraceae bacterium]